MVLFEDSVFALEVLNFHFPKYEELPDIELYRDQLLVYVEERFQPLAVDTKEPILTASMVNNYVKQKLVAPPKDKKYSRDHIAYFLVVSTLKQVLSISAINDLLRIQTAAYPMEISYNYFSEQLENAIRTVFTTRDFVMPETANHITPETHLVRSAALAIANKLYLQKYLQYYQSENFLTKNATERKTSGEKQKKNKASKPQ